MVGIVTGGNPSSTGVYYDDTWSNEYLPAGTTSCTGVLPGVEVAYTEALDKTTKNTTSSWALDAGQGLAGLPGTILSMTGKPRDLINPLFLPVILSNSCNLDSFPLFFIVLISRACTLFSIIGRPSYLQTSVPLSVLESQHDL